MAYFAYVGKSPPQNNSTNPPPSNSTNPPPSNQTNPPALISNKVLIGWRSSEYGHQSDKSASYWINTAKSYSNQISNSCPAGIWVIGETDGAGYPIGTFLSFPHSGLYSNIRFDSADRNEAYLTAFDGAGLKVFLQVEPCSADVNQLIDLVLGQYQHHSCVVGFGVDCEWWHCAEVHDGRAVTNVEAQAWEAKVKSANSDYTLFLKHYDSGHMPSTYRGNILFVDDSEENGSFQGLINEFKGWANVFSSARVAFQIGYPSDKTWWGILNNPPVAVAVRLVSEIGNCGGVFWVDFSVGDVFSGL